MKLSVFIIAHNEEQSIADAVKSASFADEVVVIDNGSTDETYAIAERSGASVIRIGQNTGYSDAKRIAMSHCHGEWLFWLDADERITDELRKQILSAVESPGGINAFRMPRKSFFLGKWIRHCGWYPDYIVRLFRHGKARFSDDLVHEKLVIEGKIGTLTAPILHYTDPTLEHYLQKFNRYTTLSARQMHSEGKKASFLDIFLRPPVTFFRMFVIRLGFLDGYEGFLLSALSSMHVLVKYAKLRFLKKNL